MPSDVPHPTVLLPASRAWGSRSGMTMLETALPLCILGFFSPSKGLFGWNSPIARDRTARFSFSPEGIAEEAALFSGPEGR